MMRFLFKYCVCLLLATGVLLLSSAAFADCTNPPGTEGAFVYNGDYNVMQYCDGTTWFALGDVRPAAGAGTCTGPAGVEGEVLYNQDHGVPQFCNGEDWIAMLRTISSPLFGFNNLTDQSTSTLVSSIILQSRATGSISISGDGSPEYRICADDACAVENHTWGSTAGSIDSGEYLQLRLTSNAANSTMNSATVTVGTASDQWDVTTEPPPIIVFVTSATYTGNLGGLSGGDDKCNALATTAGLPGTYTAWLSDSTTNAAARVTQVTYDYERVDGTVIANGWTDLTDGTLDAAIEVDENGQTVSSDVWTGTLADGTLSALDKTCADWTTSAGQQGDRGDSNRVTDNWSLSGDNPCGSVFPLYCFQD